MLRFLLASLLSVIISCNPLPAIAEDANPSEDLPYLTGDSSGVRSSLLSHGIDMQASYTVDFWSNLSGGLKRGSTFQDNLDLITSIDGEKLYDLKGFRAQVYILNNGAGSFNKNYIGAGEGVDNIEVTTQTAKLFEAWIEQDLWSERSSLRVGLYNLNSEFDTTSTSSIFLNPTYGIDTAYAATGQNGPSIFPSSSLAIRLKIAPTQKSYLMAAALDGVPGDPANPHGTHIRLGHKDGALYAAEAGHGNLKSGRFALGGWYYSTKSDHLSAVDDVGKPLRKNGKGAYILGETTLFSPDGESDRHLDGFIRLAHANDSVSQYSYSASAGLTYKGFFASCEDDIAGITIHGARNGKPYQTATLAAGSPVKKREWGVEATYSAQIMPWMSVQPDLQYISDPGTVAGIDHALIFGTRLKIDF